MPTSEQDFKALQAVQAARDIIDRAEKEARDLTGDEQAQVNLALDNGFQRVGVKWRGGEVGGSVRRPLVRGWDVGSETGSSSTSDSFAVEDPSYKSAFRSYLRTGTWTPELETKAQGEGSTSAGGAVVPKDFFTRLVVFLADAAPMLDVSRVIDAASNVIDIPRVSSHGSAAWTAENAAYNESDETFGTVSVTIHKATRLVKVSEELLSDEKLSAPDLEGYLAEEFGRALGALVNTALTIGSGSAQPYGVVTQVPGGQVNQYATGNAASIASADRLFDVYFKLLPQYRSRSVWLMNDATAKNIMTLKDTQNHYLWQASLAEGQPPTLLGRPVILNPDVAQQAANAKSLLFGDFSGFFVARRPSVTVKRLDERYADTGQVGFVGNYRVGADLIDTKAIVIGQNSAS